MSTRLLEFIRNHGIHELNSSSFGKIGSGANGEVWNVKGSDPPIIIKFTKSTNENAVKNAHREYELTKKVREKLRNRGYESFVPEVKGRFYGKNGNGALFMLEKVPGTTLQKFARTATAEQLKTIWITLESYVDALEYIGVVHGDLNPNNIMISVSPNGKDLKVSIIDFGRGRDATTKVVPQTVYSQWPTAVRCKPGAPERDCALKYSWVNRKVHPNGSKWPTAADGNRSFVRAIFGKKGGIASRATRLKNAINIIDSEKYNNLEKASNDTYEKIKNKKGTIVGKKLIEGQRSRLIKLLQVFKSENNRINNSYNAWEYYFKQIFNYKEIYKSKSVIFSGNQRLTKDDFNSKKKNKEIKNIIKKYIKILKKHQDEFHKTRSTLFKKNEKILGVHVRGTLQKIVKSHWLPLDYKSMIIETMKIFTKEKCTKIFLVSEDINYVNFFEDFFKEKMIIRDTPRSKPFFFSLHNKHFAQHKIKNNRYEMGRQTLLDSLLLSSVPVLLHDKSNVPHFSYLYSTLKQKRYQINSEYNSHSIFISRWLWYLKVYFPFFKKIKYTIKYT